SLHPRPPPTSTLFPYTTLFRSMIHMNEPQVPLYENATLLLRSDIPLADKEKWTLARCSGTRYTAIPTQREQNQFVALIRNLTDRSEEHTSELQSRENLVCRLLP